ncbi:MAG TPA: hypothetical protein GX707_17545 [Epulopiscium sp.]|nr:hypothetical protein [Candidatus Epulonipiscium sp.]
MAKFIEIDNHIINIESISKVEFISDDIFLGDFKVGENGQPLFDWYSFTFAKVVLFSGEEIELTVDLYYLEDGQSEDSWYKENRSTINVTWFRLIEALGEVTKVTEC